MFLFENRSDLYGTRPYSSGFFYCSLTFSFPLGWRTLPLFSICVCVCVYVCAIRSYLLVLHMSGNPEFTKFCLYGVFHFIDL